MKAATSIAAGLLLLGLGGCATPQAEPEDTLWMDLITVTVRKVDNERPQRPEQTEGRAVQAGGS